VFEWYFTYFCAEGCHQTPPPPKNSRIKELHGKICNSCLSLLGLFGGNSTGFMFVKGLVKPKKDLVIVPFRCNPEPHGVHYAQTS